MAARKEGAPARLTRVLSISFTPADRAWLEDSARRRKTSVAAIVREAVGAYRERHSTATNA